MLSLKVATLCCGLQWRSNCVRLHSAATTIAIATAPTNITTPRSNTATAAVCGTLDLYPGTRGLIEENNAVTRIEPARPQGYDAPGHVPLLALYDFGGTSGLPHRAATE